MTRGRKGALLGMELHRCLLTPKSLCLLLAAAAMNLTYLSGIRGALDPGETMSFLMPLLLILASPQVFPSPHFFMSAFVFFLLSQVSQAGGGLYYHLVRTDRSRWITQQIALVAAANLCMLVFFFLAAAAAMFPHLSLSISWDPGLQAWQDAQTGAWGLRMPYAVVYQASLPQAFFCAAALWWLYGVSGGLLLLAMRLGVPRVRGAGLGALFCVYFYDYICEYSLPYAARRGSPVALSRISFLNWGYDPAYPTVGYAFAFFAAVCAALVFAAMKLGKRVDLEALSFQDGGGGDPG